MGTEDVANDRDTMLVERLKEGDYSAFEALVAKYQSQIYGLAHRLTKDRMDAEDVLQEVFLQVYQKIKDFRGASAFSSWLYKIALNTALMKLRKRQHLKEASIEEAMPQFKRDGSYSEMVFHFSISPESQALRAEAKAVIEEAVEKLPEEYKAVLLLRDVEGFSAEEAHQILGSSIPAIKSRLHRARLFLRHRLENYFRARKASAT